MNINITDIMIDVETLGLAVTAPIIQIGAVGFDRRTGKTRHKLLVNIEFEDAIQNGTIEGGSLEWWFSQDEQARESLFSGDSVSLKEALLQLSRFFDMVSGEGDEPLKVWACGVVFDIGKIEHQMTRLSVPIPWDFRDIRDTRTIEDISPISRALAIEHTTGNLSQCSIAHNALDDCLWQIGYLVPMLNRITEDYA